jgi:hypothetical protein
VAFTFLLVHDGSAEDFIVTFPYVHVLYLGLVHLHYSPSYPTPLLKVGSADFTVSRSCLHKKHTNHIHPPFLSSFTLSFPLVPSL